MVTTNRELCYNIDLLLPGIYIWFNNKYFRFGGYKVSKDYPDFSIKTKYGIAVIINEEINFISNTGILD